MCSRSFSLFFSVTRNNFKVLIYFKISYLIYAELFFAFSFSFHNLVFFPLDGAFFLDEYSTKDNEAKLLNSQQHRGNQQSFLLVRFVTNSIVYLRRIYWLIEVNVRARARKIGRFHYTWVRAKVLRLEHFFLLLVWFWNSGSEGGHGTISIYIIGKLWEKRPSQKIEKQQKPRLNFSEDEKKMNPQQQQQQGTRICFSMVNNIPMSRIN